MATRVVRSGRDPWRRPRFLPIVTALYVAWSAVPLIVGVRVAFTSYHLASSPSGWSLRWFERALHDPDLLHAFRQSFLLAALTVVVAVPLGGALAVALHHMRGRRSLAASGVLVLAIATPQIAIAVSLSLLYTYIFRFVHFSTMAQAFAHVTLALPFVVVIVRARLLSLPSEMEEMAMDLGASPAETVRRVLLPLLAPSLVVAATVAFLLSFDNIVLSGLLCIPNGCRTVPVSLFGARGAVEVSPDVFAAGVGSTLITLSIGATLLLVLRRWGRNARADGQRGNVSHGWDGGPGQGR